MVFRKESKVDAFQRQISALRQQLGTGEGEGEEGQGFEEGERDRTELRDQDDRYGEETAPQDGGGFGTREVAGYSYGTYGGAGAMTTAGGGPDDDASSEMAIPTPRVDAQTSVVAHDTVWKGDLQSEGTVHVHGRVEGSIRARQDVYIAEEADVDATVTATNVVVAGLVKGTVRCGDRFEVLPPGRVAGDVQAPTLVVHEGATMTGQFRMGNGEAGETPPAESTVPRPPTVVQRRAARGGA